MIVRGTLTSKLAVEKGTSKAGKPPRLWKATEYLKDLFELAKIDEDKPKTTGKKTFRRRRTPKKISPT